MGWVRLWESRFTVDTLGAQMMELSSFGCCVYRLPGPVKSR